MLTYAVPFGFRAGYLVYHILQPHVTVDSSTLCCGLGGPPCRGPSFLWHICRKPCACEGNRIYGGCLSMLPDQRINNDKSMAMDQSFQTGRGDDWCHILKRNSNRNLEGPIAAAARLIILFFDFYVILVRLFLNKMILFFDFYFNHHDLSNIK